MREKMRLLLLFSLTVLFSCKSNCTIIEHDGEFYKVSLKKGYKKIKNSKKSTENITVIVK
jgi:hypothetical protein